MSAVCTCRQQDTISHIVDMWLLTELEVEWQSLHIVDDDALSWLESTATAVLVR